MANARSIAEPTAKDARLGLWVSNSPDLQRLVERCGSDIYGYIAYKGKSII